MDPTPSERPLLVYDGDCSFCRLWIDRWRTLTGDRVRYAPFQEVAGQFPEIPREAFARAVQLILPGGEVFSAAHAVFRSLAFVPGYAWMLWLYQRLPGAAPVAEFFYRFVARPQESALPPHAAFLGEAFRAALLLPRLLAVSAPAGYRLFLCVPFSRHPDPRLGGAKRHPAGQGISRHA